MESPAEDNFTLTEGMLCAGGVEDKAICHVIMLYSHWSSSYTTALSLVESFIVLKYFHGVATLSYAIKNQLKALVLYSIRIGGFHD